MTRLFQLKVVLGKCKKNFRN